jgi:signal transduction histidine kinase
LARVLSVCDSGSSIPEGDADRLFLRGYTTKADGMRVGLALCRTIV